MSSRTYHYRQAEELAAKSMDTSFDLSVYDRDRYAVLAQVHATLATVNATVEEGARAIECRAAERAEFAEGSAS